MSTVNDEPLTDREEGRKLYEESDKLLRLAETLQDKCEQIERRLWTLIAMSVSLIAACAGVAVYFTVRGLQSRLDNFGYDFWISGAVLVCFYGLAIGTYLYYTRARVLRQLARERRALYSIVDMLRGLEKGIAEKNNLSTLERAEFRIRLARFDIGPGE